MKKPVVWTRAVALVIFILAGSFLAIKLSSFVKPGVHTLGNYAHIDLQKNCYFISSDGKTVTEQSTFTIRGYLNDVPGNECGVFDGHMSVAKYPVAFEKGYRNHVGDITKHEIVFTCQGLALEEPAYYPYYIVTVLRENPEVIVIHVFLENGSQTAVCGATEADALANYQLYLDTRRN